MNDLTAAAKLSTVRLLIVGVLLSAPAAIASADESDAKAGAKKEKKVELITLADGKLLLTAPEGWIRKKPRVRFIEHEFATKAAEGDESDGRVTVMGAGGSVDANIQRWQGQFSNQTKSSIKKETIAGFEVHLVDITGTFSERRGPKRENYRMLAAIVVTDKLGKHFIKFYGPKKTVGENEKAFRGMIESLRKKK